MRWVTAEVGKKCPRPPPSSSDRKSLPSTENNLKIFKGVQELNNQKSLKESENEMK